MPAARERIFDSGGAPAQEDELLDTEADAEGELDGDGEMTLVSPGGLATVGLPPPSAAGGAPTGGVGKRYRPAPAKTFQCRGYGECRMVFSRSEHLARHVRKHTGERPFTCHCSKQFSRLDNLRQHAQTVHADKADLNEAMMRDLTSLHATMTGAITPAAVAAATSTSTKRGAAKRARAGTGTNAATGGSGGGAVKQEAPDDDEVGLAAAAARQRPGTSTGYEGAAAAEWGSMDVDPTHPPEAPPTPITTQPSPPQGRSRSFRGDAFEQQPARRPLYYDYGGAAVRRGPEQSFLAPYGATGGVYGYEHGGNARYDSGGSGQSFLGHPFARLSPPAHTPSPPAPGINGNTLPSAPRALAPNGNGSRPSTGNGARLPPLSAVVSSSAFRPSSGHGAPSFGVPGNGGSILLPNSLTLRRPSTGDWECDAWRPGTAPGGLGGRYGPAVAAAAVDPDVSPFSFHPPEQPAASNPRKRAFGGPDGPHGAHPDGGASGGGEGEHYEYGSESRPASRRLSVMELCNSDTDTRVEQPPSPLSVLRAGSAERERERERERPTTTNGLVSRASALVLHDREQQPRFEPGHAHAEHLAAAGSRGRAGSLRGRDAAAPGGAAAAGARGGGDAGGVPAAAAFLPGAGAAAHRGGAVPPHAAAAAAAAAVPAALRGRASTSASPPASPGYGPPGPGYGGGGGVSPPRGAYGGGGGGGFAFAGGLPAPGGGGQRAGIGGGLAGGGGGGGVPAPGLAPVAVFARVPAYAAPVPGVRGDDGGVQRRYAAGGGHAEVRELEFGGAGAGRGPGPAGYEHEHGHRVGGRRGGGMRV